MGDPFFFFGGGRYERMIRNTRKLMMSGRNVKSLVENSQEKKCKAIDENILLTTNLY